jgi:hypothetical protein
MVYGENWDILKRGDTQIVHFPPHLLEKVEAPRIHAEEELRERGQIATREMHNFM